MDASGRRMWLVLVPVAMGVFVVVMDVTVVNVALPSIREDLGYLDVTVSDLQWVVNAYSLAFAVLMLGGGKLADILGRRRVFLIGLVAFALASLGAGLTESIDLLIVFRALQGVGAALVLPATLALVTVGFPPAKRAIAVAIWSALVGLGVAIGPLVGGLLSEEIDWRWVFLVNVPFCGLAFVFALLWVTESRAPPEHRSFDPVGVLLSTAALFCLVFGLQKANEFDWGDPRTVGLLAAALLAGLAFARWERRTDAPILDLSLFRSPTFTGANVVSLVSGFVLIGAIFYINLLTQSAMAYGPVEAGAVLLPMTVLSVAFAPLVGRLTDRFGPRWLLTFGMLLLAASLLLGVRLGFDSDFWDLMPILILAGIGFAFVLTPVVAAALAGVPVRQAAVGSAVVNTARQAGGALGLAVMGAVSADIITDSLAVGQTRLEGFVEAFGPVMIVGAVAAGLGALIAAATVVGKLPQAAAPAGAPPASDRPSAVRRVSWTVPGPEAGRSVGAISKQLAVLGGGGAVARLEVLTGPAAGARIAIGPEAMVFGRTEQGIGRLGDDNELSRRHARISHHDGKLLIEDLGSTNGTRVNSGEISEPTTVGAGEVIELGRTELRVAELPAPPATGAVPCLEVVAGPAAGSRIEVGQAPFVLGRAEMDEGRLGDDPEISRRHASASLLDPARILIEDLGSTNGTFVNGVRIGAPTVVGLGDSIQLGGTTLKAVAPEPSRAPSAHAGSETTR